MTRALLHGFCGDPSVWDGFAREGDIVPALHARTVAPTWDQNLDAIARDIAGCDVVVGYSFGARIALGLLVRGVVPRAVLIGVNPGIADAERAARRTSDAAWAHRFRTEPLADVLDAWEGQALFATQARVGAARLAERRHTRLALDPELLAQSLEVMGLAEMPTYVVPADRATLIVGADDAKFLAIARAQSAPLHVIADAGHDPLLEQPAALAKVLASLT